MPDTTTFLLERNGIKSQPFWKKVRKFIENGWDPPMAWMTEILKLIKSGKIAQNTNQKLTELGKEIVPYKGVPDFVSELNTLINKKKYREAEIELEFYIISSGIEDLINGTVLLKHFADIFAGRFAEDESTGLITSIKSIVTFTEKTKFLYAINKGISGEKLRTNPYLVNNRVKKDSRRIPFENMIYLGDSTGDVPCFSAIKHFGGDGIGIVTENTIKKGYDLAKERRSTVGPYIADYRKGSQLRLNLGNMVTQIADRILAKSRIQ